MHRRSSKLFCAAITTTLFVSAQVPDRIPEELEPGGSIVSPKLVGEREQICDESLELIPRGHYQLKIKRGKLVLTITYDANVVGRLCVLARKSKGQDAVTVYELRHDSSTRRRGARRTVLRRKVDREAVVNVRDADGVIRLVH